MPRAARPCGPASAEWRVAGPAPSWLRGRRRLPSGRRGFRRGGRGFGCGCRGVGLDQPQKFAQLGVEGLPDIRVVLKELAGILAALPDAVAFVAEPRTARSEEH